MSAHLRLLEGEQLLHERAPLVVPSLEAQPARPGEMPETLLVRLTQSATDRVRADTARTGIPAGLWVRIAVEAARHVVDLSTALRLHRNELESELNESASLPLDNVGLLHGRRQLSYARHLREADARNIQRGPLAARVEVPAPDWTITAWLHAAAREGVELDTYLSGLAAEAPADAVKWEARAAELGLTLGEWIYSEGLAVRGR